MRSIQRRVLVAPRLLADCLDVIRFHLGTSKIPDGPIDLQRPYLSEEDIPPAIQLAILSLEILAADESILTPGQPNLRVKEDIEKNWAGISSWLEWLCTNMIIAGPQSNYMFFCQSRVHIAVFNTVETVLIRFQLRAQIVTNSSLLVLLWRIWLLEPTMVENYARFHRMTPSTMDWIIGDRSFSRLVLDVAVENGQIIESNHFRHAEIRDILQDSEVVVAVAIQHIAQSTYATKPPSYVSLNADFGLLSTLVRHPPLLQPFLRKEVSDTVLGVCAFLTRRSTLSSTDSLWSTSSALIAALEFLSFAVQSGVHPTINCIDSGLLIILMKCGRVLWKKEKYRAHALSGNPAAPNHGTVVREVLTKLERYLEVIIPLITIRAVMRRMQKSVKHIRAHNLEPLMLARPETELLSKHWDLMIQFLDGVQKVYDTYFANAVGGLYNNVCSNEVRSRAIMRWTSTHAKRLPIPIEARRTLGT